MNATPAVSAPRGRPAGRADRLARRLDTALRFLADPRLAVALLLAVGAWNAMAAMLPGGRTLLEGVPYRLGLLSVVLCGVAAVAVRAPSAWREWRSPAALPGREGTDLRLPLADPPDANTWESLATVLGSAGFRTALAGTQQAPVLAGVRRGWSRFAAMGSHLAISLLVVGAAMTATLASERTFSLVPGQEALLGEPGSGEAVAVRLDAFDAAFGADGRPSQLDSRVTFLRSGSPAEQDLLQVNRPGQFAGYLVHGWTYGPAARLRVETLAGRPLMDAPLALDGVIGGRPGGFAELDSVGLTLGVSLADASSNRVSVGLAGGDGLVDAASIGPGESRRVGSLVVSNLGLTSYVTFLSRSDPGMGVLFTGAALLVVTLAVGLWFPRRRVTLRLSRDRRSLLVALRGERFDDPGPERAALAARILAALAQP